MNRRTSHIVALLDEIAFLASKVYVDPLPLLGDETVQTSLDVSNFRNLELKLFRNQYLDEIQTIQNPQRLTQFLLGRLCAHAAIEKILKTPALNVHKISKTAKGAPIWPYGLCGSITHKDNLIIAVVSRTLQSVGIDLERTHIQEKLAKRILTPKELKTALPGQLGFFFSAKESAFKCVSGCVEIQPSFQNFEIEEWNGERFWIRELKFKKSLEGHVRILGDFILTGVKV